MSDFFLYSKAILFANPSEEKILIKGDDSFLIKKENGQTLEVPTFFIKEGVEGFLKKMTQFVASVSVQHGSGPLQPEDESLFAETKKKLFDNAKQMAETIESTIQKIKTRKSAENLTTRPE